ncbi:HD domain-containing phosphohydrolase [Petroclostridium sp. X23]|uniref:HD domain-containing phosphohydrolase n=1 Tax=Petroclostridium sp. X23 TaxID=3045146 RepID=UPI0024ACCB30|nr:HD domain-containing phosphohydrolase [Petroclostridium sp. X23]WHH61303.1 HD domain-containing protein [Petroclostridium sp. X23]
MISSIIERQCIDSKDLTDLCFFDSISDPILIHDFYGNLIYVNRSATKIYGYLEDELIGKNICEIRGELAGTMDIRSQSLKNNGQDVFEAFEHRKDGSIIYVRVHQYILKKCNNGLILTVVHHLSDIDERTYNSTNKERYSLEHYLRIVNTLLSITEIRDPYTANHQKRVANLAYKTAQVFGLSADKRQGIYIAGLLHDIGKIYVPNEILTRPGRINDYEFSIIKKHSEIGYSILSKLCFPWKIKDYVIQHHERIDGTGYPFKLTGDNIYLESMVLAVADVVEAMASHRPYRPALGIDKALEEIEDGKNTIYNCDIVNACKLVLTSNTFDFDKAPEDME